MKGDLITLKRISVTYKYSLIQIIHTCRNSAHMGVYFVNYFADTSNPFHSKPLEDRQYCEDFLVSTSILLGIFLCGFWKQLEYPWRKNKGSVYTIKTLFFKYSYYLDRNMVKISFFPLPTI